MKKILFSLVILVSLTSLAQSSLSINPSETYFGLPNETLNASFDVTNNSDGDLEVIVTRLIPEAYDSLEGFTSTFCWGVTCYPPHINVSSNPIIINAGASFDGFKGTISSMPLETELTINYCFSVVDNPSDKVCSDVIFSSTNPSGELTACPYPYYFEYDSNYTIADISMCITYIIEGCTNSLAENYNPEANFEDGTCVIIGCMSEDADNYNAAATLQDESCILYGCTNETAENYNDLATDDDGSCLIYGCILEIFPNYNPEATVDDLSCNPNGMELYGCTNQLALNYDSQANMDNGSCIYQDSLEDCGSQIQEESIPLYLPGGWTIFGYTCIEPVDAILGFSNVIEQVVIVKDSEGNAYLPDYFFNGIGDLIYSRGYQIKTTEEILDFSFCLTLIPAVEGCTDENAINFDSLATLDNGSCEYGVASVSDQILGNWTIDSSSLSILLPEEMITMLIMMSSMMSPENFEEEMGFPMPSSQAEWEEIALNGFTQDGEITGTISLTSTMFTLNNTDETIELAYELVNDDTIQFTNPDEGFEYFTIEEVSETNLTLTTSVIEEEDGMSTESMVKIYLSK